MNSLGRDIGPGTFVVLKEDALKPEYRDITWRVFRADGGFGMKSFTIGTALMGMFVRDGEEARMEGHQIERLATDDEVAAAEEAP